MICEEQKHKSQTVKEIPVNLVGYLLEQVRKHKGSLGKPVGTSSLSGRIKPRKPNSERCLFGEVVRSRLLGGSFGVRYSDS